MTTVDAGNPAASEVRPRVTPRMRRRRPWPDSWPIWVGVAGFPVFWALGITPLLFPVLAIPVTWKLLRRGHVRFPPGFGIWALFLIWVLASAVMLNQHAPGTLPPSGNGRFFAYGLRFADYLAMT